MWKPDSIMDSHAHQPMSVSPSLAPPLARLAPLQRVVSVLMTRNAPPRNVWIPHASRLLPSTRFVKTLKSSANTPSIASNPLSQEWARFVSLSWVETVVRLTPNVPLVFIAILLVKLNWLTQQLAVRGITTDAPQESAPPTHALLPLKLDKIARMMPSAGLLPSAIAYLLASPRDILQQPVLWPKSASQMCALARSVLLRLGMR